MIIQEFDLFDGINDEIVEDLVTTMKTETYGADDLVFKEGDPADSFYILVSGAAELYMGGRDKTASITLKPGEAFGWSSLVERDVYASTVRCTEACRLYKININILDRVLRQHPSTAMLFYKRLAGLIGGRVISCHRELLKLRASPNAPQ
jgi:CRP-like cAMP-binding protein